MPCIVRLSMFPWQVKQCVAGSISTFSDIRSKFLSNFTTRRSQAKHPLTLFDIEQHVGETIRDYMDRYNRVVLEVNVWNQAVVALGFTAGLLEGYKNGTPFSILLIIGRAVPQYPALLYLVPRKTDIGTSAAQEGKFSANWKGLFCIREDPRKGTFKLENLAGAKVPRSWNTTDLTKYYSKFS
ncbi:hypothetical protein PIB30_055665 [Stylosanthes scabra]|uniref:Retrotransposon gag domain-containing protein n=1 Tax=Stylosanthes scabra TaxID=79078 RepID=A0ABU6YI07_9FABA|nr:hypothetical protein [Stylosanthes scabra]